MRLDEYISLSQNISRSKAQSLIKDGLVFVDGLVAQKPAKEIKDGQKVEIKQHADFVSRGAYKLLGAIEQFGIDLKNKIVLDMGASTGGFTQVALQSGSQKVYAVDVGKGQLDPLLAGDRRVENLQSTDIRLLSTKNCPGVNFIVGDLSFVSLQKILPHIKAEFGVLPCVLLFKPQFECGAKIAKKYNGIIKDKKIHTTLLKEFVEYLKTFGYTISGLAHSSIKGGDGNIEYMFYLNGKSQASPNIENIVENAFKSLK